MGSKLQNMKKQECVNTQDTVCGPLHGSTRGKKEGGHVRPGPYPAARNTICIRWDYRDEKNRCPSRPRLKLGHGTFLPHS